MQGASPLLYTLISIFKIYYTKCIKNGLDSLKALKIFRCKLLKKVAETSLDTMATIQGKNRGGKLYFSPENR